MTNAARYRARKDSPRKEAAFILALAALGLAVMFYTGSLAHPCGVPPGDSCTTDTECECLHGADE